MLIDECKISLREGDLREAQIFTLTFSKSIKDSLTDDKKKLSLEELSNMRAQELYFNCDDKFSSDHTWKKFFSIERVYEEKEEPLEENGPKE